MSVRITSSSRLNYYQLITADGVEFWQTKLLKIPTSIEDIRYTVKFTDRLDSIANNFYGDPDAWWIIALANQIELVPEDLYEGQILTIPSPRWVNRNIGSLDVNL